MVIFYIILNKEVNVSAKRYWYQQAVDGFLRFRKMLLRFEILKLKFVVPMWFWTRTRIINVAVDKFHFSLTTGWTLLRLFRAAYNIFKIREESNNWKTGVGTTLVCTIRFTCIKFKIIAIPPLLTTFQILIIDAASQADEAEFATKRDRHNNYFVRYFRQLKKKNKKIASRNIMTSDIYI